MAQTVPFGEVLEAVEQLSTEDQQALIDIVNRRLADEGRKRVLADVREAREQFQNGACTPTTPADLMREILS